MIKESTIIDSILIYLPMFTNAFPRILSIALLCAFFKIYGIVPFIIIFIILSLICWKDWINESKQKLFLGLVTCLMSPCLVINDYSFFFMKISIIGNIFYLVTIWMMYALLKKDVMNSKSTTIFECVNITNLPSFNMTNRCLKMPEIGSNVECQEGFWSVTDNFQQRANVSLNKIFLTTVCPIGYEQWHYLFIMLMIITSFFLIGFLSTYFLHQYLDAIWKMKNFNIWKERDRFWLEDLKKFLYGNGNVDGTNEKLLNQYNKTLIEMCVDSKLHSLVKVNIKTNQIRVK